MKRGRILKHKFVEYIPDHLEENTIYISVTFATVVHKCCCGCGNEVVTPLSPTDWKLIFDGRSISLDPSIGNWNFACKSHYWIESNRVKWARTWSKKEINAGRSHDLLAKKRFFSGTMASSADNTIDRVGGSRKNKQLKKLWQKLKTYLS